MELRQLRHFIAVATHGNFSRAARHLNLTQPALSRQVKNLEDELGITLFLRDVNSVKLTPKGRDFYLEVVQVVSQLEKLVQKTKQPDRDVPLKVGYLSCCGNMLPHAMKSFMAGTKTIAPELLDLTP